MKKIYSVLLAGAISAGAICGTVACGENEQPNGPEEPVVFDERAPAYSDPSVTLSVSGAVDRMNEERKISKSLFGAFLEDINYASYAMDDNMVCNGSFENRRGDKKYAWTASGATFSVEDTEGVLGSLYEKYNGERVNPNYAKLVLPASGGTLKNAGFPAVPFAVKEGVDYAFSAFVKTGSYHGNMTVRVKSDSKVYFEKTVALTASTEWVKYSASAPAEETGSEGLYFELAFDSAGTVLLDGVAFETTDSTVGIKNYVYEAIKDLSPKFIRFPGGCVIEGTSDSEAYDWKNSIGAVAKTGGDVVPAFTYKESVNGEISEVTTYGEPVTRAANTDIWRNGYYEMEYAVGFYEYFLLCESVGASAVPVLNCGLSCQGGLAQGDRRPKPLSGRFGNGVADFIQDAKDLIEFAKGGTDTKWGKIRADLGHPDPFEMDYLGIGNEQSGIYYTQYYEKFLEAFAEDPDPLLKTVKLIVGNGPLFSQCQHGDKPNSMGLAQRAANVFYNKSAVIGKIADYGVHDQHYYMNYTDFFTNTTMYDGYARPADSPSEYYEVFVGEYSANEAKNNSGNDFGFDGNAWRNSWVTALSEAAMMTAYERNGDIIKLAAYAPMFAPLKESDRQWAVDMMYFTNTELLRTTNYYVQQFFMQNQGDYKLNSSIKFTDGFLTTCSLKGARAEQEIDKLYYVTSRTEGGDVLVKIVNASGEDIRMNVALSDAVLRGSAKVTVLSGESYKTVNTLENTEVAPKEYTIGDFTENTLGYTAPAYSVTCIRLYTK